MTEFKTLNTFQPESAKQVYEALTAAKTAFDKEDDYLYVLDTNALLKTYSFDSDSFNKLKKFFESHKGKIFATHTVEIEYIRNRETVSNSYAVVSKKKFVEAFNKIGDTIESLYSDPGFNYSYLMKDNKDLCEKIKGLHENYKTVSNDVANYEKSLSKDSADAFKLQCLELIVNNIDFTTKLTDESHYSLLEKEFEELHKKYKDERKNNKKITPNFPGCGEDNPQKSGDYIIFYEMMELSKAKGKNVVLLTNDVAKDDWVDNNGKTFERYQIMFYAITGRSFVVHKYDDFLKDKIGIEPQVLEESKDNAEQSRNEDVYDAYEFLNLYREFAQIISKFLGRPIAPRMFFRHYRNYIDDDLFNKLDYIAYCRDYIIQLPSSQLYDVNAVDLDRAIDYIKELVEALPMIFQAISRARRVTKQ